MSGVPCDNARAVCSYPSPAILTPHPYLVGPEKSLVVRANYSSAAVVLHDGPPQVADGVPGFDLLREVGPPLLLQPKRELPHEVLIRLQHFDKRLVSLRTKGRKKKKDGTSAQTAICEPSLRARSSWQGKGICRGEDE